MRYIFKNKLYIFLISAIDFLGNLFLKTPKDKRPPNVGSILVIRFDHIGDVIFSTAAPKSLKEHYRGAKITFLVASWAKELVLNNPYIDEVMCYDAPWFSRDKKKPFEFIRFLNLARELRKQRYDLGFDLRGDFRHILLMALAKVKFRISYGITGGEFLLHKCVDYRQNVHSIEHNSDLLKALGITIITDKPQLYSSEDERKSADDFLRVNNLTDKDTIVVIHPYAGYTSKNWLDERYIELADALYKDYNAKVVLVGSEADKERSDNLAGMSKPPMLNLAGKTSLGVLLELIKRSSLFIGVDSGPSHIAASTSTPMVVLYSGTNNSSQWHIKSGHAAIIQKEISCKGCEKLNCEDNICMDLISVEDVLEAIGDVIKRDTP